MAYSVLTKNSAEQELRKQQGDIQKRIAAKIKSLADNPRPRGVKKLHDEDCLYRIRVGDYRAVYQINDKSQTVTVARIAHRREVYD